MTEARVYPWNVLPARELHSLPGSERWECAAIAVTLSHQGVSLWPPASTKTVSTQTMSQRAVAPFPTQKSSLKHTILIAVIKWQTVARQQGVQNCL